jgi:hypothetical protein
MPGDVGAWEWVPCDSGSSDNDCDILGVRCVRIFTITVMIQVFVWKTFFKPRQHCAAREMVFSGVHTSSWWFFLIAQKYYIAEGKILGTLHASVNPWKRMNLHFLIMGQITLKILYYLILDSGSFQKGQNFYQALIVTYHYICMMTFYFSFQHLFTMHCFFIIEH